MEVRRDSSFLDAAVEGEHGWSVAESAMEAAGDDPVAWIWVVGEP